MRRRQRGQQHEHHHQHRHHQQQQEDRAHRQRHRPKRKHKARHDGVERDTVQAHVSWDAAEAQLAELHAGFRARVAQSRSAGDILTGRYRVLASGLVGGLTLGGMHSALRLPVNDGAMQTAVVGLALAAAAAFAVALGLMDGPLPVTQGESDLGRAARPSITKTTAQKIAHPPPKTRSPEAATRTRTPSSCDQARHNSHRLPELRARLQRVDAKGSQYMTDEYLLSVMDQESSKDATVKRTFEYAATKLEAALRARADFPFLQHEFDADKKPDRSPALQRVLNNDGYYLYGYTYDGRPVVWFFVASRDRRIETGDLSKQQLMLFMEAMSRSCPPGVTDCVAVNMTRGVSRHNVDLRAELELQQLFEIAFPDRLHQLYLVGANAFVRFLFRVAAPLMPRRVVAKMHMVSSKGAFNTLSSIMPPEIIPDYLGGPCAHTARGDFDAMVSRQMAQREQWMAQSQSSTTPVL